MPLTLQLTPPWSEACVSNFELRFLTYTFSFSVLMHYFKQCLLFVYLFYTLPCTHAQTTSLRWMQVQNDKIYSSIYCHLFQPKRVPLAKVSPAKLGAQKLIHELKAKRKELTLEYKTGRRECGDIYISRYLHVHFQMNNSYHAAGLIKYVINHKLQALL